MRFSPGQSAEAVRMDQVVKNAGASALKLLA